MGLTMLAALQSPVPCSKQTQLETKQLLQEMVLKNVQIF
jgi:hypothetical protein